jgi:ATPase subunit of ABC transporter with duplicated ATPase domains
MSAKKPVLRVENGTFFYGAKKIFDQITFSIDQARTALVGDNGAGKSTLLKCLTGEEHLSSGEIIKGKGTRISYLAQEVPVRLHNIPVRELYEQRLLEAHRPHELWMGETLLAELGIPYEDWGKSLGQFSGGWQRILLIASALRLEQPDIVILDEPTNHLDIGNIYRLEELLINDGRMPLLIVSHDREFLDKVTTKTIFLRKDGAHVFKTSFNAARNELAQRDVANAKARALEEKEVTRLQEMAKRFAVWGAVNSDFHKKQKATEKRIDRLQDNRTESYTQKERSFSLHDGTIDAEVALRIIDHLVTTPDKSRLLYTIDRLVIKRGDRIALLGENGTGKTMLLQAIAAAYDPGLQYYDGTASIRFNPQTKMQYFDQKIAVLPEKMTLINYIEQHDLPNRNTAVACLANAGFAFERIDDPIMKLSYGEKSRLLFLAMSLSKPNFYLLDEPTNHLDIDGQEKLEENLYSKNVSCIFVSHDRYFTRMAANRFIEIRKGKLHEVESPDAFFKKQMSV